MVYEGYWLTEKIEHIFYTEHRKKKCVTTQNWELLGIGEIFQIYVISFIYRRYIIMGKNAKYLTDETIEENQHTFRNFKKTNIKRYVSSQDLKEKHRKGKIKIDENGVEISRETGKPLQKNRGVNLPNIEDLEPDSVQSISVQLAPIMMWPRCRTQEELIERFDMLIDFVCNTGVAPSMDLFCLAFDIMSGTVRDWRSGKHGALKEILVKKYQQFSQAILFQATTKNKLNPIVWMFYSKNWFDYSDKREIEVSSTTQGELSHEEQMKIINDLPNTDIIDV